ncbi:MAG: CopG family transcriptional regulator [Acidobacteriaceae bacterium]|nr:CopG family transcriptional regulator [Acidobacteriaceae bacterium]
MIRTQISLSADEYERLKRHARVLGLSIAEVIRRAVREALPHEQGGAWMRFAGFIHSGDRNASQSIDEIVYGAKD